MHWISHDSPTSKLYLFLSKLNVRLPLPDGTTMMHDAFIYTILNGRFYVLASATPPEDTL